MKVHHHDSEHRLEPERGHQLGATWSTQIRDAVAAYRGYFRELGISPDTATEIADTSFEALSSWSPPHGRELVSIAEGAGVSLQDLSMLNARTEIMSTTKKSGEGECSTAVRVPGVDGQTVPTIAFQTWDWHAPVVPAGLMWRYQPAPDRWVKTFTEPGMLAKLGVNSMGLAVHLNIMHHRTDGGTAGGVPVHVIARRLLDEAATVAEAYEIARSAPVSASTVLTVVATASPAPAAASLEISPAGTELIEPRADGWLLHTNHFVGAGLSPGDALPEVSTSHARYQHLHGVVGDHVDGTALPALARALCDGAEAGAPICMSENTDIAPALRNRTLLTVRLDPVAGVLEYWPGSPDEAARADPAPRL